MVVSWLASLAFITTNWFYFSPDGGFVFSLQLRVLCRVSLCGFNSILKAVSPQGRATFFADKESSQRQNRIAILSLAGPEGVSNFVANKSPR
jgi:hypothetical protein